LTKNSSSYWEGDSNRESLQRIYGISFPDTKQLKEWQHFQEEAAKRNHRKIGQVNRFGYQFEFYALTLIKNVFL